MKRMQGFILLFFGAMPGLSSLRLMTYLSELLYFILDKKHETFTDLFLSSEIGKANHNMHDLRFISS